MYSQFSEVRFSSVALARADQQLPGTFEEVQLTDSIVKGVLLSAEHDEEGKTQRDQIERIGFVELRDVCGWSQRKNTGRIKLRLDQFACLAESCH